MSDSRFNSIKDGNFTVISANVRRQLVSAFTKCRRALLQAGDGNVSAIIVGGSAVSGALASRKGISLIPGSTFQLNIENLKEIWIDGGKAGDKINYVYFD